MIYVLCVLGGLFVGIILHRIYVRMTSASGTFYLNSTDPNKDIFTLDLDNVDDIYVKKTIVAKINRDYEITSK